MMRKLTGNWIALLVFTGLALYLSWRIISPFVDVIIWSAVLAVVSYPVYRRWRARGRGNAAAAFFTTTFVVLLIVIPILLVGAMLVRQVPETIQSAQETIPKLIDPNTRIYKAIDRYVDIDHLREKQWWADQAKQFSGSAATVTIGVVGGVAGTIIQMLFVLFTLYYMLKDADTILPAIRKTLPLEPAQAEEVFTRSREIISASLNGVLIISVIQGALGGLGFWALGLPSPVLWGVVMFFMSMIPMAGAAVVWVPAAIYLFATGHYVKGILLVVWGGGVIGLIDNFLRPRLVGERAKLHELLVFFSVLGGLQVFGVLGLVVGPVVVAISLSLLEVFKRIEWGVPSGGTPPVAAAVAVPVAIAPSPVAERPPIN